MYARKLDYQRITSARQGLAQVDMAEYNFTLHNRFKRTIPVHQPRVIVIEGLFVLCDVNLGDMMSLKIYVDTASDIASSAAYKEILPNAAAR